MSALELYCKVRSILMTEQTFRAWGFSLRKAQHISKARYDCGPKTFACLAWLAWVGLRHSCFWLITSTTSGAPLSATYPSSKCQNVYDHVTWVWAWQMCNSWARHNLLFPKHWEYIYITSGRAGVAQRSGCSLEACRGKNSNSYQKSTIPIKACRDRICSNSYQKSTILIQGCDRLQWQECGGWRWGRRSTDDHCQRWADWSASSQVDWHYYLHGNPVPISWALP